MFNWFNGDSDRRISGWRRKGGSRRFGWVEEWRTSGHRSGETRLGLLLGENTRNLRLKRRVLLNSEWVFFENLTEGQFASASPAPNSWGLLPPVSVIYMHAKSLRTPQVGVGNVLPMSVCLSVSRMTQHVMCGLS